MPPTIMAPTWPINSHARAASWKERLHRTSRTFAAQVSGAGGVVVPPAADEVRGGAAENFSLTHTLARQCEHCMPPAAMPMRTLHANANSVCQREHCMPTRTLHANSMPMRIRAPCPSEHRRLCLLRPCLLRQPKQRDGQPAKCYADAPKCSADAPSLPFPPLCFWLHASRAAGLFRVYLAHPEHQPPQRALPLPLLPSCQSACVSGRPRSLRLRPPCSRLSPS